MTTETEQEMQTFRIATDLPPELGPQLRDAIESAADVMLVSVMHGRPLKTYGPFADYYDAFKYTSTPELWFRRFTESAQLLDEIATSTATSPFTLTHMDYIRLFRPEGGCGAIMQDDLREDFVRFDTDLEHEQVPFTAFEILLYMNIIRGAQPARYLQGISEHLTHAMRVNPHAAWNGMAAFRFDMLLPHFPNLMLSQCDRISETLDSWDTQSRNGEDGIDFFVQTLEAEGILARQENESTQDAWRRITQLLPGFEEYIDFNLPTNTYQSPEYYMRIVLALSYFGLHRRFQFSEDNETIAAIVVRRSDGAILGAAVNEPVPGENDYIHAEHLAIERAREYLGDQNYMFEDCDIFISCEPCDKKCGPELRQLNFHGLYTGPRTNEGADTLSGLFTNETNREGLPIVVQFDMFTEAFDRLFTDKLRWESFVAARITQSK